MSPLRHVAFTSNLRRHYAKVHGCILRPCATVYVAAASLRGAWVLNHPRTHMRMCQRATPRHATPRHAIPRHTMSRQDMPRMQVLADPLGCGTALRNAAALRGNVRPQSCPF